MHNKRLHIFTAADYNYVPFLASHIYSLATHAEPLTDLNITIFHQGIPFNVQAEVSTLIDKRHIINWIEVTTELCVSVNAPNFSLLPANYFRLLAPYIFTEYNRVVYLDADTIVLDSLLPLFNISLNGFALGAVMDWLPTIKDAVQNWKQLGLNGDEPYFNSGLLVIDLEIWRKDNISAKAFEICSRNSNFLKAQGKWAQHEQYGLNVTVQGRWKQLSPIWNHFTERPEEDIQPKVLHYLGQGKPGSSRCLPQFTDTFKRMISNTPWKGWLPK